MCDPLTIGLATVAVGSKVAGDIAANNAIKKERAATIKSANISLDQQLQDLQARATEERSAAQLEGQTQREMSLAEMGVAQASAADSNVSGASVDAAASALQRRASIGQDVTTSNLDAVLQQLNRNAGGAYAERDNRVNAAPKPKSGGLIALDALGLAAQSAIPYIK